MHPPSAETAPASLGHFVVAGVLGSGGSSTVYDVTGEREATTHYALKVLREDQALSDGERQRFFDEAARMRKVEHPALVPLVEAGELPDGRPYLLMPRISGETLARRVARGPLSTDEAVRHVGALADGLAALHAAGMVHRDVKPENIVVQHGVPDRAMLLDFGIAREIEGASGTTTARGHVRGTPAYMAPERFFGAPASVSSDVYELGVVFYMMLTGRLPWSAEAYAAERLNPRSPEEAGVPRALAIVCLRALCTRPEMRPQSAEAFAAAVRDAALEPSQVVRTTADLPVITVAFPAALGAEERDPKAALELTPRDTGAQSLRPRRGGWIAIALVSATILALGIKAKTRLPFAAPAAMAVPPPPSTAIPAASSAEPMAVAAPLLTAPLLTTTAPAEPAEPAKNAPARTAEQRPRSVPSSVPSTLARPAPSAKSSGDRYLEDRR